MPEAKVHCHAPRKIRGPSATLGMTQKRWDGTLTITQHKSDTITIAKDNATPARSRLVSRSMRDFLDCHRWNRATNRATLHRNAPRLSL